MKDFIFDLQRFADKDWYYTTANGTTASVNNLADAIKGVNNGGTIYALNTDKVTDGPITIPASGKDSLKVALRGKNWAINKGLTVGSGASLTITGGGSNAEDTAVSGGGFNSNKLISNLNILKFEGLGVTLSSGSLSNGDNGTLTIGNSTVNAKTFTNSGTAAIDNSTVTISGTFTNGGTAAIDSSTVTLGGTLTNSGTVEIGNSTVTLSGTFTNNGTASIDKSIVNISGNFTNGTGGTVSSVTDSTINLIGNGKSFADKTHTYTNGTAQSTLKLVYDGSGAATIDLSSNVKNFSMSDGTNDSVDYTFSNSWLSAKSGTVNKYYPTSFTSDSASVAVGNIVFDELTEYLSISGGAITISSGGLSNLTENTSIHILENNNFSSLYGAITRSGNDFAVETVENSNASLRSVKISGGETVTFDKYFADTLQVSITTADNSRFVPISSDNGFTVSGGSNSTPAKVDGASEVSLVAGSLQTSNDQNISVVANTSIVSGTDIYAVSNNSDGMTFSVGAVGDITLGGLESTVDSFTVGGTSYSVRSLGFIQQTTDSYKIYYSNDSHSLTGGTVTANELTADNYWWDVISVTSNGAATIPSNASNAVFINTGFTAKYGTLEANGSEYTLTRGNGDSLLSTLSIAGDEATLTAGASLNNLQINSSVASIKIADDNNDGYQVTLSGAASVSGASKVSLIGGAAQLDSTTPYYVGSTSFGALSSAVISLSVSSSETTISGLDSGESFQVGGTSYTLLSNGRFQRSDSSIWNSNTISGSVTYASLTADANWNDIVEATEGVLTIENLPSNGTTAYVVDNSNHASIYGTLSRNGSAYTLDTVDANASLSEISIGGSNKTVSLTKDFLNTSITAGATFQVTTADSGFTVNYSSTATSISDATEINLLEGTLTLSDSSQTVKAGENTFNVESGTITATYKDNQLTIGSLDTAGDSVKIGSKTYTLTKGAITISVANGSATINGIGNDDKFTITDGSSTDYYCISAGFVKCVDKKDYYLYSGEFSSSIKVDDLIDSASWTEILPTDGDKFDNLTVDSSTITNGLSKRVANVKGLPDSLTLYGTLSKSGSTYSLTQANDDILPASIKIDGTKIELPANYSNPITTKSNATFNVSSSATYTVDDTGTYPTVSKVDLITVTSGEIQAALNQSIVVGGKTVIPTSGEMTVGYNSDGFVGNLNIGDKFTVDGTAYEVTAAGLFDAKNIRLVQNVTTTYNLSDPARDIIAISGTTLDLTKQTSDALVYDSITKPTTFLATFTAGAVMNLQGEDGAAAKIKTVKIAKDSSIDVDFATQVNASGTVIVNGQTYAGSTSLVIASDGSSSTLYSGTVKLDTGTPSVTADIDAAVVKGSITATASGGTLTKIGALDATDSFTVGNTTYTQSAVGLLQGGKICAALAGSSVDAAKLSTAIFSDMIALQDGVLNLSGATSAVVVDNISNPTKILGNLTVNDSDYTVDFATKATVSGEVTVNGQTYSTVGTVTLTTTATSSKLYDGTINLNGVVTATAKAGNFVSIGAIDSGDQFTFDGSDYVMSDIGLLKDGELVTKGFSGGTLTLADIKTATLITPTGGVLDLPDKSVVVVDNLTNPTKILGNVTIDGATCTVDFETQIKTSKAVTVNGVTYSPVGSIIISTTATDSALYTGTVNVDNITHTAKDGVIISVGKIDLGDEFSINGNNYVMTDIGLLKDGALVTNGFKNSTLTLADVQTATLIAPVNGIIDLPNTSATVVDDLDNPTQILGNLTVDGTTYKLDFAAQVQTSSNVTINGQSYSPVGNIIVSTTAKTSSLYDGTINFGNVTLTAENSEIISVGNINLGDTFALNDSYTMTAAGLISDGKLVTSGYSDGTLTLADIQTSPIIAPQNGVIELPNSSAVVVDNLNAPTKILGNLTVDGSAYNLDFAAQVQASGNVTINGQKYSSTDDIIIDTATDSSTLKSGTVYLAAGDSVTTSSGNTIVATDGEFTLTAGDNLTFGKLAAGDGFTLDGKEYARTALGLFRVNVDDQDIYTANLGSQISDAQLATNNWSPIITIANGNLNINANLNSGIVLSDDLTVRFAALTKDSNGYTLSEPVTKLNSIAVNDVKATLAATFATVPLTADDTKISNITLTAKKTTFDVDATGDLPKLTNVQAFTLDSGAVNVTAGQTVTAGDNVFVASTGNFILDADSVRQINGSDKFTLNGTDYALTSIGLITDAQLVTGGFNSGTLNIADIQTTPLIAPVNGIITLPNHSAVAVDSLTNPTQILGNITVDDSGYNVDFAAQVQASGNVTVNDQTFDATGDIIIKTTATDATIYSGTLNVGNVTATYQSGKIVSFGSIDAGDSFTFGDKTYTMTPVGLLNDGKIDISLTGDTLTAAQINSAKFSDTQAISDAELTLNDKTLANGKAVVLVDATDYPTKIYGELSKTGGVYTLDTDDATDKITAITVDKTAVNIDNDLAGIQITTHTLDDTESVFSVKASENSDSYYVDATQNSLDIERAGEIDMIKGRLSGGDSNVVIGENSEGVELELGNGNHNISDDKIKVEGLDDGETVSATTDDEGNVTTISGMTEGSSVTIDGTTYTAPEDDSTLTYTDKDGWYFEGYEKDEYTVNINRRGNVSVDAGVKLNTVVESGKTVDDGEVELAVNTAQIPVTVNNESSGNLTVSDEQGNLIEKLSRGATAEISRSDDEIILTVSDDADLTLNAGDYSVNGVEFTAADKTQLTTGTDGVEIDLTKSGKVTIDGKTVSGDGSLTATADKVLVDGTVTISDVKIITDKPTDLSIVDDIDYVGKATYTVENGKVTAAQISDTLSGDFSDGLIVNGNPVTVTGGNATVSADGDITTGAGSVTINGHAFTTTDEATYHTANGSVKGVDITGGTLTLRNESNFSVNDSTLSLTGNTKPVTLNIADDGEVTAVSGVNGSIDGLKDTTVYDAGKATINGKKIRVAGSDCTAVVSDGEAVGLVGLTSGATISSAPSMTLKTSTSGDFTVGDQSYHVSDSDHSFNMLTDSSGAVTDITDFAGSISGGVGEVTLNGKDFGTNNASVTVSSDGTNITGVYGIKSGDSIGGDIDEISFTLPRGNVTINDNKLTLRGEDSVQVSSGGKTITGLDKDSSLSATAAGVYNVNGKTFAASENQSFTVNRDGAYAINAPNYLPIIETTPADVVESRGYILQESNGTVSGDKVAVRGEANVTVEVDGTNIIATSGSVTLENYNGDNATVQTYEYTNISGAVLGNRIEFGDGVMTLGDAVITFNANMPSTGGTMSRLVNAVGRGLDVGFTHGNGGTVDASDSDGALLKGNYRTERGNTAKSGNGSLKGGTGNDTLLIGGNDTADAGAGSNVIYITDSRLKDTAATIRLSGGKTRVMNFNAGYAAASDRILVSDLTNLEFGMSGSQFVIGSGNGEIILESFGSSGDMAFSADKSDDVYRLKLSDGNQDYNAAIATDDAQISVTNSEVANLYYGSDVTFSEYSGAVNVNLSTGTGNVGGNAARLYGVNKLEGGTGKTQLTGSRAAETLIAGTGDSSLNGGGGADLLIGRGDKDGTTTFYYLAEGGYDTIEGFDFGTSGDLIDITRANAVTDVWLDGDNVIMRINHSDEDNLTLTDAKGERFRINNLLAKVDGNISYDAFTNCYVADATNATMTVGRDAGDADVWLNDNDGGLHGKYYLGDITVLDARQATGSNILAGNALENVIYGGGDANSIWGGYGYNNDTLIGGAAHNTFYFGQVNGSDVVENAHDGDVIDLTTVYLNQVKATEITADGATVILEDNSRLQVNSNANMEYRLRDGTYKADHVAGVWNKN